MQRYMKICPIQKGKKQPTGIDSVPERAQVLDFAAMALNQLL